MSFYRVYPEPRIALDSDTVEGKQHLAALYASPATPVVRANMIVTPTGKTTGDDGTSGSLSSPADRTLVSALRDQADAVLIGAETLRRERIPLPAAAPLVVITGSGQIRWENLVTTDTESEVVVVTATPDTVTRPPIPLPHRILKPTSGKMTPGGIVSACRAEGWDHLLLEGGQHTLTQFVNHNLVDELCLTLTGPPLVESIPPIPWWPDHTAWSTVHLLTDDNRMLYQRYRKVVTSPPENR